MCRHSIVVCVALGLGIAAAIQGIPHIEHIGTVRKRRAGHISRAAAQGQAT